MLFQLRYTYMDTYRVGYGNFSQFRSKVVHKVVQRYVDRNIVNSLEFEIETGSLLFLEQRTNPRDDHILFLDDHPFSV